MQKLSHQTLISIYNSRALSISGKFAIGSFQYGKITQTLLLKKITDSNSSFFNCPSLILNQFDLPNARRPPLHKAVTLFAYDFTDGTTP